MPSWNIHTAHAEALLACPGAKALGIRDVDAFLLGNILPDVYVGYMVSDVSRKIAYKDTHFAEPTFVPEPRYWEFFERFGSRGTDGQVSDVVLGAWAHLVADHDYNLHNNAFIASRGIAPGEQTRIKKQADFDLFGRTLDISLVPQVTPEVLRQCADFPQYAVDGEDVRKAAAVMARIVEDNAVRHVSATPSYQMLDAEFFSSTFDEVTRHIRQGLLDFAAGRPDWGGRS